MIPQLQPISPKVGDYPFQVIAADLLTERLFSPCEVEGYKFPNGLYGVGLQGGTGVGKTYIMLRLIRNNLDKLVPIEGSFNPFRVLVLVPASAKITFQRAVVLYGLASVVHVMSYGEVRSKNSPYILWTTQSYLSKEGKPELAYDPYWNPKMLPALIISDECQVGRNENTSTTKILTAIPSHTMGVKVILSSATMFQRLSEARMFMVTTGVITPFNRLPLTQANYPTVAHELCAQGRDPWDYSPKNIKNLKECASRWFVEVKGVRFKHKAHTELLELDFRSQEQRGQYDEAYREYKEKMCSLNRNKGYFDTGLICEKWVALQKFRQKAEILRVPELTERAVYHVEWGKQAIIASNFIDTLRGCWTYATRKLNISKDRIGFIVGGQSMNARQEIIDKWQRGELDLLLLTMKAGGVALNLHHELTSARPRAIILPPTYAAPEFVQVLGRVLRLTNLSDVIQEVIWLKGTVETQSVLPRVAIKLKCLDAAVTAKEQWGHMLEGFVLSEDEDEGEIERKIKKLEDIYQTAYADDNKNEIGEDGGYKTEEGELEMIGGEGLSNEV